MSFYNPIFKIRFGNINIITNEILNADIDVQMDTDFEGDKIIIKIYNIGDIEDLFLKQGDPVEVTLGYDTFDSHIITGIISSIYNDDDLGETVRIIEAIDESIWNLKHTPVNLSINVPTDVIEIIRQIASQAGVVLSLDSIPSGVILQDYTVNKKIAYNEIDELAKRIKYSVSAKKNRLFVTQNLISALVSIPIDDNIGLKLTPIETRINEKNVKGFHFHGSGNPSLIPLSNVSVAIIEEGIFGNFIVESVEHMYSSDKGYVSSGVLIDANSNEENVNLIQLQTYKSIANTILKRIEEKIKTINTIEFGDIESIKTLERLFTVLVGFEELDNQSIINRSIETKVGNNNVFLNNKPGSSIFAGNGYGVIVPVYSGNRAILTHNNKDSQDVNIIGYLWKKGDAIPDHDEGEFQIHMKEHSKISLKEDGHGIIETKGLKITAGSLSESKPVKTSDNKILLEANDIFLGDGATLGAARLNDAVLLDAGLLSWLNGHIHPTTAPGAPTGPPTPGHTGTDAGTIKEASSKTKIE
jgi:hypothetical protein